MPELPEVETVRRQLVTKLVGTTLIELDVVDARWCLPQSVEVLAKAVEGRAILALERRGKYLVLVLTGEIFLLMHLRMTGTLLYGAKLEPPHTRVRITLDDGGRLLFVDPRRFGTGQLVEGKAALEQFFASRLGVEPFSSDFTAELFASLAEGSRTTIKAFLLNQRKVVGVGNIYADEALFRARIHPARLAGSLKPKELKLLQSTVLAALTAGIEARGATIDDFRHVDGARGSFQNNFLVHRRAGKPCPECGTEIVKTKVAQRGTYLCPRCQRVPTSKR